MRLTQDQDEIQTFASDASDKPFTNGVGFRGKVRRMDDFDTRAFSRMGKLRLAIAICLMRATISSAIRSLRGPLFDFKYKRTF